jgi:hypothetical protein
MMSDNPFAAVLTEQLEEGKQSQESLIVLQEFCRGIEQSTDNRVQCELERGTVVTYGQEWRPVMRSRDGGPPHLLFRAYVPLGSWPVTLDLHETALTRCEGKDDLTRALQDFLRDPNVIAQIQYVMWHPSPVPAQG